MVVFNCTSNPGPGAYNNLFSITPTGKQFLSKWGSSKAQTFNPVSSTRFKSFCFLLTQLSCIQALGAITLSQRFSLMVRTLFQTSSLHQAGGLGKRRGTCTTRSFHVSAYIVSPGPGNYVMPSDFGIYKAQEKYIKEIERMESNKAKKCGGEEKKPSRSVAKDINI
jgi:hypothetical protein